MEKNPVHTRIEGTFCCLRTVSDGLFACGLAVWDMRLRWQSGLVVETARIGATALNGNGPAQLMFRDTVDDLAGCIDSASHNYAFADVDVEEKVLGCGRTSQ
jgi:hypothetical protein